MSSTEKWSKQYESWIQDNYIPGRTFPPKLEVKDPKVVENTQRELGYIFELESVKQNQDFSDNISIYLRKGEESKRPILPSTPRINIEFARDENGDIVEKTLYFQRDVKYCEFIFSNNGGKEVMNIGENNLDSHYNEAIYGWVQTGIRLFRNTIEGDKCTVSASIEYSDNSSDITDSTEPSVKGTPKGPMEI